MKGFNVIALDNKFQIITLLRSSNLQWNRKYHEAGSFSIQIPLNQYSKEIRYIYTKDRPELGKVSQINYIQKERYSSVQLSGYFLEKEPDRHVVFQNGVSNIINAPTWSFQSGKAEDVAYAYFNAFKTMKTANEGSDLGIVPGESKGRGKESIHYRNGEYLGWKIYDILKPSGMSYRVKYDFYNSRKQFECWSGIDRTENNSERNNPIVFSTKYGNIKNPNILMDDSSYKNACLITNEQTDSDVTTYISRAVFNAAIGDGEYWFLQDNSSLNRNEYGSDELAAAMDNEGLNALVDYPRIVNVDFDALENSYEYRKDFDLGDKCTVVIAEIGMTLEARLIGCYEVMKSGQWSMNMEFGTPIIIKR